MSTREIIVVTDDATRADLEQAIAALRAKAQRWSRSDPRRAEVDAEVDLLVEDWIAAEA